MQNFSVGATVPRWDEAMIFTAWPANPGGSVAAPVIAQGTEQEMLPVFHGEMFFGGTVPACGNPNGQDAAQQHGVTDDTTEAQQPTGIQQLAKCCWVHQAREGAAFPGQM